MFVDAFDVIGDIFTSIREWFYFKYIPGLYPFTMWHLILATFVISLAFLVYSRLSK